ncbi:hypothetical protein [Paracoccus halophilus]|uniref:hypothetical protein n=1 Tax=Paracoccus halophilus TaxID=376733 RepID=UPI001113A9B5|nr:hypothetical protein [Paracoccus halophilus]
MKTTKNLWKEGNPVLSGEPWQQSDIPILCGSLSTWRRGQKPRRFFYLFISPHQTISACGGFPLLYLFPTKTASRQRRVFTSLHFHQNESRIFGQSLSLPELSGFFLFYFNDGGPLRGLHATPPKKPKAEAENQRFSPVIHR